MKNENYFMDQRSVPAVRWDGKDDKIPSELLGTWKLLDFGNIVQGKQTNDDETYCFINKVSYGHLLFRLKRR